MAISLCPLPYALDALSPHISAETLKLHHGAHHKGYVDKTNKAIAGTALADKSLNDIVKAGKREGADWFNNAAQAWNHGFYWHSLSPDKSKPSSALKAAIDGSFGSSAKLAEALGTAAKDHFASGWAWLVASGDKLSVVDTHDAATALTSRANPLLCIDVWEHAYYLDVQNKRPDYVDAVISQLLNWSFASENFERGSAWTYPD